MFFLLAMVTILHVIILVVIRGRTHGSSHGSMVRTMSKARERQFEPTSFKHKLQASYVDVMIFAAMPVMTKSAAWLHCRTADTTPDGTARVLISPSVVCEGMDYFLPAAIAAVCLLAVGLGFPALIIYQIHLRTSSVPTLELGNHSFYVEGIDTTVSGTRDFDEMCRQLKSKAATAGVTCVGVEWNQPGLMNHECKELILASTIESKRNADLEFSDPIWEVLEPSSPDGRRPGHSVRSTWKRQQLQSLGDMPLAELQKEGVRSLVSLMLAHGFEVMDHECLKTDQRSEKEGGCVLNVGVSLPGWPSRKGWAYVTFKHKDTCKYLLEHSGGVITFLDDGTHAQMIDLNLLWSLGNFGESKRLWTEAQTKLENLKSALHKQVGNILAPDTVISSRALVSASAWDSINHCWTLYSKYAVCSIRATLWYHLRPISFTIVIQQYKKGLEFTIRLTRYC